MAGELIAHNAITMTPQGVTSGILVSSATDVQIIDNLISSGGGGFAMMPSTSVSVTDGSAQVVRNAVFSGNTLPPAPYVGTVRGTPYDGNPSFASDCTGMTSCILCDSFYFQNLEFDQPFPAGMPCALTTGAGAVPPTDIAGNPRTSMSPYGAFATTGGACKP